MPSQAYREFLDLLKRKAFTEAALCAERNSVLEGDQSEFWLTQQAVALVRARHFDRAAAIAEKALRLAPGNHYALLAKADACLGAGKIHEALQCYEEVLRNGDSRVLGRSQKGILECLDHDKNWVRILECLAEWNLVPTTAVRWRVKALSGLGRRDEAHEACREWLRLSPDNPQALWELTRIEIAKEGIEAVRTRLGRLSRIPSRPPIYREIYASLCRKSGKTEEAVDQYEKLTATGADTRIQRKHAFTLAKAGQELAAIPLMEELLKANPQDFYIHSGYVGACKRAGQLERARKFYQDLSAMHPEVKTLYGKIRRIDKEIEATS